MRTACFALVTGLLLAVGGCAGGLVGPAPAPPAAVAPVAAAGPSVSAKMVCENEAQADIAVALGVTAQRVETPTWNDRLYSCRYDYADGSFQMSVKDLASEQETTQYFESLATTLGRARTLAALGEGAFITGNGSVVVRKDFKVLLVDNSALPPRLADTTATPANVALLVAKTIMGCWVGA